MINKNLESVVAVLSLKILRGYSQKWHLKNDEWITLDSNNAEATVAIEQSAWEGQLI